MGSNARIVSELEAQAQEFFKRQRWRDKARSNLLKSCTKDLLVRTDFFRFVDVLPGLKSSRAVVDHFMEYVGPHKARLPSYFAALISATNSMRGRGRDPIIARAIRYFVRQAIANYYIVDSSKDSILRKRVIAFRKSGFDVTLDTLGEHKVSFEEADAYLEEQIRLIHLMATIPAPQGFRNDISVKLSSFVPSGQWNPIAFEDCINLVALKLMSVLVAGMENRVSVNVDVEEFRVRDLTVAIFKKALENFAYRRPEKAGIVLQAYLKDSEAVLDDLLYWSATKKIPFVLRIVKGAYWDYERDKAELLGWPVPVFTQKSETDEQFNHLVSKTLEAQIKGVPVDLAVGTHNFESIAHAVCERERIGACGQIFEAQVLNGIGDHIRYAVKKVLSNVALRVYMPYGDLVKGIAYLVRRLLEHTSEESKLLDFV